MIQSWRRYVGFVAWWTLDPPHAARGDRGEGVISAAIAVLIMAGIGALMWVGLQGDLGGHRGQHQGQGGRDRRVR